MSHHVQLLVFRASSLPRSYDAAYRLAEQHVRHTQAASHPVPFDGYHALPDHAGLVRHASLKHDPGNFHALRADALLREAQYLLRLQEHFLVALAAHGGITREDIGAWVRTHSGTPEQDTAYLGHLAMQTFQPGYTAAWSTPVLQAAALASPTVGWALLRAILHHAGRWSAEAGYYDFTHRTGSAAQPHAWNAPDTLAVLLEAHA